MRSHPDVMFVIFADHSNKQSVRYSVDQAPEGETDIYHPFLFIILPQNETRFFDQNELQALQSNQQRLVTVRDLHFLLAKFWSSANKSEETGNK